MTSESVHTPSFAVIDVGTNAIRFEIYHNTPPIPSRIFQERLVLRLGDGADRTGRINPASIPNLLQAFRTFCAQCQQSGVASISAAGTSIFRQAEDAEAVVEQVRETCGVTIEILSGKKEAELIAKGIFHFEPEMPTHALLIDIGGGSTELTVACDRKATFSTSLPLGAIYAQNGILGDAPPSPANCDLLRSTVRALYQASDLPPLSSLCQTAVCSSGTARALSALAASDTFTRSWLNSSIVSLESATLDEIKKNAGIHEERADIILAGAIILSELLERTTIETIRISQYSLRHGLLIESIDRYYS
jgi:exopolyphosphatase/guanosine-5'-triphosphate,3'-diphosphate pyrophosphatase